jgi:hypothetical protein
MTGLLRKASSVAAPGRSAGAEVQPHLNRLQSRNPKPDALFFEEIGAFPVAIRPQEAGEANEVNLSGASDPDA